MDIKINNKIDSLFPKLDKETYIALKKDIKENGIQVDLVVSKDTPNLEDGTILCGANVKYGEVWYADECEPTCNRCKSIYDKIKKEEKK